MSRAIRAISVALVLPAGCLAPAEPAGAEPAGAEPAGADPAAPSAGVAVYVGEQSVRGYRPRPMLRTNVTAVPAAKFPAVDVHCHWTIDADPAAMLAAMDDRNVRAAVNLSGGWGEELEQMLARFHAFAPDRFIILCNIDFSRIDEPDFGRAMVEHLETAKRNGTRGLKIFKDLGLRIRDGSGRIVAVDDARLDPIWSACGRLDLPVLIHSGDPAAFFEPIDRNNERWMQLTRHPDWSFAGEEYPDRETVFAQRDRMIGRHPKTQFICAHFGGRAEDLAAAARLLEKHPNVSLDIAGRVAELGRQPYAARRFLIRYQDRALFGTDRYPGRPDQPRYRIYFRFLETDDEHFDYYDHPFAPTGEWRIYGVFLPDEVLAKIYHENADRILGR